MNIKTTPANNFFDLKIKKIIIGDKEKEHYSFIFLEGKYNKMLNIKIEQVLKIFQTKEKEKIRDIYNKMKPEERKELIRNVPHTLIEFGKLDDRMLLLKKGEN